jgi:hypothetical protein
MLRLFRVASRVLQWCWLQRHKLHVHVLVMCDALAAGPQARCIQDHVMFIVTSVISSVLLFGAAGLPAVGCGTQGWRPCMYG